MRYLNIDYSRLLSYDEIKNLNNNDYQTIINFCKQCHSKYVNQWNNNNSRHKMADGHYYYCYHRYPVPGGPINGNVMRDANYFKNSRSPMLINIDDKYRELILTNYMARNNELFIKILKQTLSNTVFSNLNLLFEQIQTLVFLYHTNRQKFLFMKTALKIEYNLIPILELFYEYYQITDPVIIINKITEIYAKYPHLLNNNKVYSKK